MPKTRWEVTQKGCLDNYENPTKFCASLSEMTAFSGKREFACRQGFPPNCKKDVKDLDSKWKGQLANMKSYADDSNRQKWVASERDLTKK
jgi:hypothetical protein